MVDHVDIFLDVMRMDHDIDVGGRLDIDDYAISPADALIAKLQIGRINQKDVHDVIALLKDVPLRDIDDDASLDLPYFAEVCSRDWGLYQDITTNLDVVLAMVDDYGLSEEELARVHGRLAAIKEAVRTKAKSLRWRLRARVGKRVAWRREIEDTEGARSSRPSGTGGATWAEYASGELDSGPARCRPRSPFRRLSRPFHVACSGSPHRPTRPFRAACPSVTRSLGRCSTSSSAAASDLRCTAVCRADNAFWDLRRQ